MGSSNGPAGLDIETHAARDHLAAGLDPRDLPILRAVCDVCEHKCSDDVEGERHDDCQHKRAR